MAIRLSKGLQKANHNSLGPNHMLIPFVLPQVGILRWILPGSQQSPMLCFEEMLLPGNLRVQYFIDIEEHQQVTP